MTISNPQPLSPSIVQADFKSTPNDFIVHELLSIEFSHHGEHLWLHLKKTNLNTTFVAKLLAKWANIPVSDVGYSGLKDRRAVTQQWFSLRLPSTKPPSRDFDEFLSTQALHDDENIQLLEQHWHHKKLNRGTHKHNQFIIRLTNVVGDKHEIDKQLSIIQHKGVPNYFGNQRFGIDGKNIENAQIFFEALISSKQPYKPHKKSLEKHAMYISSAKSLIFNAILAKRVLLNNWDTAIDGDVFNLDGSGSIFTDSSDDNIHQRLLTGDIHIASILFGTGQSKATNQASMIEKDILSLPEFTIFQQGLLKVGSKLSYRPLRLIPKKLSWQWQDDNLTLTFVLPSGTFATSILAALVATLKQPQSTLSIHQFG